MRRRWRWRSCRCPARAELLQQGNSRAALEQRAFAGSDAQVFFDARAAAWQALADDQLNKLREKEPPPAGALDAASFCPLCRQQYRAGFQRCADCGVELQPLAKNDGGVRNVLPYAAGE